MAGLNTGATAAASLLTKPTSNGNLCSFIPCDSNDLMSCLLAFRQFSNFLNIFLDTWQSFFLETLAIPYEDFKYVKKKKHGLPAFDLNSPPPKKKTVSEPTHHNGRILFLGKTRALRFRTQSRNSS